jgi:hypothetical protein
VIAFELRACQTTSPEGWLVAYDLDSPKVLPRLQSKIELQEANLRGLVTYARGARYILMIAIMLFAGAVFSWFTEHRTLAAWLIGYTALCWVTHYLFAPLLAHYAQSAERELAELQELYEQALARQKERPS